jgi:ribosomal protein S18 acetylase RimI-like enzyme
MEYTSAERRANAAKQVRDRFGRFAEMGRSSKFGYRDANGATQSGIGKFIGASDMPGFGRFLVTKKDGKLAPGVYHIKFDNFENIKAEIDLDYLKEQGLLTPEGTPSSLTDDQIPNIAEIRRDETTELDRKLADLQIPELPDLNKIAKENKSQTIKVRDLKPGVIVQDSVTNRLALVTDVVFGSDGTTVFLRFQDGERRISYANTSGSVSGWVPKGEPPAAPEDINKPTQEQDETQVAVKDLKTGDKVLNEATGTFSTVISRKETADGKIELVLKDADGVETTVVDDDPNHEIKVWRTPYLGESGVAGKDLKQSEIATKSSGTVKDNVIQFLKNIKQNILPIRSITEEPQDPELPPIVQMSGQALENLKQLRYLGGTAADMLPKTSTGAYDMEAISSMVREQLGPDATALEIAAMADIHIKKAEADTREFNVLRIGDNFFLRYRSEDLKTGTLNRYLEEVQLLASKLGIDGTPVVVSLIPEGDVGPGGKIMREGIPGINTRLLGVTIYEENTGQGIHVALNATALEDGNKNAPRAIFHEHGHVAHHILMGYKKNPGSDVNKEFRRQFKPEIDAYFNKIKGNGKPVEVNMATAEKEVFADLFGDAFKAINVDKVLPTDQRLLRFVKFFNENVQGNGSADLDSAYLSTKINATGEIFETLKKEPSLEQLEIEAEPSLDLIENNFGAASVSIRPTAFDTRIQVDTPPSHEGLSDKPAGLTDPEKIAETLKRKYDERAELLKKYGDEPHYMQGGMVALSYNTGMFGDTEKSLGGSLSITAKVGKDGTIYFSPSVTGPGREFDGAEVVRYFDTLDAAIAQASESLAQVNSKWGKTDIDEFRRDPKVAQQISELWDRALGQSDKKKASGSSRFEAPKKESETAPAVPYVAPQPIKDGRATKDGGSYRFNPDGSIDGGAGAAGILYIPKINQLGEPSVQAIMVRGKPSSPESYLSSDDNGEITLTEIDPETKDATYTSLGNISEMFNDKNAARASAAAMANTVAAPAQREAAAKKTAPKVFGIQNARAKEIIKLIEPNESFRVGTSGKTSLLTFNFNGAGKPTNGGFGGYISDEGEVFPGQSALSVVVVDSEGAELRRNLVRFTEYNKSTALGSAKLDLAKAIAAEESRLSGPSGEGSDEMADMSQVFSDYNLTEMPTPFPKVQKDATSQEFNDRKFFYEMALTPSGKPIPVGPDRDKVVSAYLKVLEWDNLGQIMFSDEQDKKALDSAVADLKKIYDDIFFSGDLPEPSVNLSGLKTGPEQSSDEMADYRDHISRVDANNPTVVGSKTRNNENDYERLHPALLVRDELTGRIGRVRGLVHTANSETGDLSTSGEFEIEFYEGRLEDIQTGIVVSNEFDDTGKKTEVVGTFTPTSVGSDIDERRVYSVEIRDPEDFTDVSSSYIAITPDGPVPVHESMFGVIKDTKQVGSVAGFLEDGKLLISAKRSDGSSQYVSIDSSNFVPLKVQSSSGTPHGEVRGNDVYVTDSEKPTASQILQTQMLINKLDNMGFVDPTLAAATRTMVSKGYLNATGYSQLRFLMSSHDSLRKAKVQSGRDAGRKPMAVLPSNPIVVAAKSILEALNVEDSDEGLEVAETISQVVESDDPDNPVKKPTNRQLLSVERRLKNPAGLLSPERESQVRQMLPLMDSRMIGSVIKELDVAELDYRMDNGLPINDLYKPDKNLPGNPLVIRNITPTQASRLVGYKPTKNMDGSAVKVDEMSDTEISETAEIKLSEEQQDVFNDVESSNRNTFISGPAGTGKSVLLRAIRDDSSKSNNTVVAAPTAAAALLVGGQTLQSLFPGDFRVPYWAQNVFEILGNKKYMNDEKRAVLRSMERLVIDEVSMVNADLMDHIDRMLRVVKGKLDTPFGGVQVVMFGDPYQLPPVVNDDPNDLHTKTFNEDYQSPWFWHADVWADSTMRKTELTQIFRQTDSRTQDLFNALRDGSITQAQLDEINAAGKVTESRLPNQDALRIFGVNRAVDERNDQRFEEVSKGKKVITSKATIKGPGFSNSKAHPTSEILSLAEGVRVMFIKNAMPDREGGRAWLNGSYGTVTAVGEDQVSVLIDGNETPTLVPKEVWEKSEYRAKPYTRKDGSIGSAISAEGGTGSTFEQFPLRLGYAITSHKSQGQTYKEAVVDLGPTGAFAPGQAYVAISRVQSLEGLYLPTPLRMRDVKIDPNVTRFMKGEDPRLSGGSGASDEMADTPAPAPKNEPFDPSDPNLDLDTVGNYDFTKRPDGQPLSPDQSDFMEKMQSRVDAGPFADMYRAMRRDMYDSWFSRPTKSKENSLEAVEARTEILSSEGSDKNLGGRKVTKASYVDQYGRMYEMKITTRVSRLSDGTLVKLPDVQATDITAGKAKSEYVGSFGTEVSRDDTKDAFAPKDSVYISTVETEEPYRRRGLATAMLSLAREVSGTKIQHSRATTSFGNAFANSIGDDQDLIPTSSPTMVDFLADPKDVSKGDEMADEPFDPLDPNLDLDEMYKYDFTKTPDGEPLSDSQLKAMEAATAEIESIPDSNKTWKESLKAVRRDLYRSWFVSKESSPENTIDAVTSRLKFNDTLPMSQDILRASPNIPVSSYANYTDQYGREYVIVVESVRDGYLGKNRAAALVYDARDPEKRIGSLFSDGDINGGNGPVYVHGVNVNETYRRRGLATALLVAARTLSDEDIHHSKDTTAFGNAFANSIGDDPDKIKTRKPSITRDKWMSDDNSDEMADEPTPSFSALSKQGVTMFANRDLESGEIALLKTKEAFFTEGSVLDPGSDLFNAAAKVFMTGHPSTIGLPEESHEFETLARAVIGLSSNSGEDVRIVDQINRARRIFNPDHKDLSLKDAYEIASQQVGEFFKDSELQLRINPTGLIGMLNSDKYMTQHEMDWEEHQKGGGSSAYAPWVRAGMEHIWFGDPDHHPVYGYFKSKIQPMPTNLGAYGHIILHLTEEAKIRSTASIGDSLVEKNSAIPFVWDKGLDSSSKISPRILMRLVESYLDSNGTDNYLSEIPDYVEAQIHGSVTPKDIARVTIDLTTPRAKSNATMMGKESYSAMITDLKLRLNALGIKYDVID